MPPTTTTHSRRCAWWAPPSRSAPRTSSGCSARAEAPPPRRWQGWWRGARSSRSSSRDAGHSIHSLRSSSSPSPGSRPSRPWRVRLPKPAPRSTPLRVRVDAHDHRQLVEGWQVASCPPDAHGDPTTLEELNWLPARVPGTAAGALRDAGRWRPGDERDLDSEDWWFRTRFDADPAGEGEELALQLDGI